MRRKSLIFWAATILTLSLAGAFVLAISLIGCEKETPTSPEPEPQVCPMCGGTGWITCPTCDGTGLIYRELRYEVIDTDSYHWHNRNFWGTITNTYQNCSITLRNTDDKAGTFQVNFRLFDPASTQKSASEEILAGQTEKISITFDLTPGVSSYSWTYEVKSPELSFTCPDCGGKGKVRCPKCGGTGIID